MSVPVDGRLGGLIYTHHVAIAGLRSAKPLVTGAKPGTLIAATDRMKAPGAMNTVFGENA